MTSIDKLNYVRELIPEEFRDMEIGVEITPEHGIAALKVENNIFTLAVDSKFFDENLEIKRFVIAH